MISTKSTERFSQLFAGSELAHGRYVIEEGARPNKKGKIEGKASTEEGDATLADYALHLEGHEAIGVIPIRKNNDCVFGGIDIDAYNGFDIKALFEKIEASKLCLVPTRSKSGGIHLWQFVVTAVPAAMMRRRLAKCVEILGLDKNTEIFPKQDKLDPEARKSEGNRFGNWINVPWYAASKTERYGWRVENGSEIRDLEEWIEYAWRYRITLAHFEEHAEVPLPRAPAERLVPVRDVDASIIPDGPICLNRLLGAGVTEGSRNDIAYQLAVYAKSKYGGDRDKIVEFLSELQNEHFSPPLEEKETLTVAQNVINNDQNRYKCRQPPFNRPEICHSQGCRARRYGVRFDLHGLEIIRATRIIGLAANGKEYVDPAKTHFRISMAWNGVEFEYEQSATQIMDAGRVRNELLARGFGYHEIDAGAWREMITTPVNQAETEYIQEEFTPIGRLRLVLINFLSFAKPDGQVEDLARGLPWHNEEEAEYWFLLSDLTRAMRSSSYNEIKDLRLEKTLKEYFSATRYRRRLFKGKNPVAYWSVPATVMTLDESSSE